MTTAAPTMNDDIRWYVFHRWLNPFKQRQLELVSPMTPVDITEKLNLHIATSGRFRGTQPFFVGEVTPNRVELQRGSSNQPGPRLAGQLHESSEGTLLISIVGLRHRDAVRSTMGGLGFVFITVIGWIWIATSGIGFPSVFLPLAGTVMLALYVINRWISRHEHRFYEKFLSEALAARRSRGTA